jgi:hypothetical protein
MKSLADIEAAAEALPPEQKAKLLRFLAERLRQQPTAPSPSLKLSLSKRGFPVSTGLLPFTSGDVKRIEVET